MRKYYSNTLSSLCQSSNKVPALADCVIFTFRPNYIFISKNIVQTREIKLNYNFVADIDKEMWDKTALSTRAPHGRLFARLGLCTCSRSRLMRPRQKFAFIFHDRHVTILPYHFISWAMKTSICSSSDNFSLSTPKI